MIKVILKFFIKNINLKHKIKTQISSSPQIHRSFFFFTKIFLQHCNKIHTHDSKTRELTIKYITYLFLKN